MRITRPSAFEPNGKGLMKNGGPQDMIFLMPLLFTIFFMSKPLRSMGPHFSYILFLLCPFTGPEIFFAGPNFLCRTKNLFTFCASHKHFVTDKKMICIQ